ERADIEFEQILRFSTRRGIPIEKRTAHFGNNDAVSRCVLPRKGLREGGIVLENCRPGSASGIGAKRLAFLLHESDNLFQAMLLNERQMLCETLTAGDAILRPANRPKQNHAQCDFRIRDTPG